MYGYDGNMTALDFAALCGFKTLKPCDQALLVAQGHYTADGRRIARNDGKNLKGGVDGKLE